MLKKTVLIMGFFLLFSACSEKGKRAMYKEQLNLFDSQIHTSAEKDYRSMQNGENPMKRPSYEEYREQ